jgi:hypothetical protein
VLSEVFDGDLVYLTKASWNVAKQEADGKKWSRYYYMPAQADRYQ